MYPRHGRAWGRPAQAAEEQNEGPQASHAAAAGRPDRTQTGKNLGKSRSRHSSKDWQAASRLLRRPDRADARPFHRALARIGQAGRQGTVRMKADPAVREAMLAAVPGLRAFAMSLCGKMDRADDLVQETLLRALGNIDSFEPGTNMSAWLLTILRTLFRSEYRKRRRQE